MEVNPIDENDGTTPRAILARRLRTARTRADLTVRALAEEIDYPYGYLSRVENGRQLPSDALAEALDKRFGTDGLFGELLAMSRTHLIADYSRAVVEREADACRIQVFTSSLVPGLLQVEEYARSLFRMGLPSATAEQLEHHVEARMARRRVLDRSAPPYYWAMMDEAALCRPIGGRAGMARQLRHVLEVAEKPCVTVQILPFGQGAHTMLGGGLTLLTLEGGETIGLVESFANGEPVRSPTRILELSQGFDLARSQSLPSAESLALIEHYLKGYEDEDEPRCDT
ncbi:helix-turn-helix transcriptional regulator [Streptomyces sp. P38-E01]|uniref:Helix-turn-helix transcriptional regulator n=1 Tax=Streptomyces tardus TaxID=2780544 RepID=A0A949JKT4_9ACTN|nr:helix-turn-helix transcriptional regulator [Streptomyces tardus]MBU7598044.1 helix-turn-helix transcriptional regulator [Streptomyces tardus]